MSGLTAEHLAAAQQVAEWLAGRDGSGPLKAEAAHSGAMLAFMLDEDESALLGSIGDYTPDHMTLLFLAQDAGDLDREQMAALVAVLKAFGESSAPFAIEVSGVGRFLTDEGAGANAVYASVDSPSLPGFRQELLQRVRATGIEPNTEHGFTPHITLGYVGAMLPTPDVAPPLITLAFDTLSLIAGDTRTDFPLSGSADYKSIKMGLPDTEDYDVVRADFVNRLTDAFLIFASTGGASSRASRNAAARAVAEDVPAAFYAGYKDAGGDDTEDEDESWLTAEQGRQLAFMTDALAAVRGAGDVSTEDAIGARVEMWAATLDGIFSEGKLRGSKNMMCYFDGDDGDESCSDCQDLKAGPPRSVKYILAHELVPKPGNENFECGCWKCKHNWRSVKTDEWMTF